MPINLQNLLTGPARDELERALPDFLIRQRWFGAKSRKIETVTLGTITALNGIDAVLSTIEIVFADRTQQTYQLPLGVRLGQADGNGFSNPTAIIATLNTSEGTATVYDAVSDGEFRRELFRLTAETENSPPPSRISSAEQSNTSVVYGDVCILKLYRRLQAGENPDVEISRFLTREAHFKSIPAYLGQLQGQEGSTLAFLQEFAPNQGDGWEWMQTQLAGFYRATESVPAPARFAEMSGFSNQSTLSKSLRELASDALEAASLLGRRTAEMHLALATPTSDAAFAAEAFTSNDLATDSTRIHNQITSALDTLKSSLGKVPASLTESAVQLLGHRKELLERAHVLATASPYRFGRRIRIHGDYHLGQVLRTSDDFLIVDFEGEPARSLEERRRKQSPLRDVAGMLRSFSYAANAALETNTQTNDSQRSWAVEWEKAVSFAFLSAYREFISALPELIPQPEQAQAILTALLLEKALYELLYELNNRPSWLHIPLNGALSLIREAA